eukprot:UN02181
MLLIRHQVILIQVLILVAYLSDWTQLLKMLVVVDWIDFYFVALKTLKLSLCHEEYGLFMCLPQLLVVFLLCLVDLWIITLEIILNLAGQCVKLIHWIQRTDTYINQCQIYLEGCRKPVIPGSGEPIFLDHRRREGHMLVKTDVLRCSQYQTELYLRTWPGSGESVRFIMIIIVKF